MPDLPVPVHLIAQTPGLDAVRLFVPVCRPEITVVCAGLHITIFQHRKRFLDSLGSKIHCIDRCNLCRVRPLHKFIQTDLVCLNTFPRQIPLPRAFLHRSDPVPPVIVGDKIAPGIAHRRDPHLPYLLQHIAPESVFICSLMRRLVDAGVHHSSHVLHEGAVDTVVNPAFCKCRISFNCHMSHLLSPLPLFFHSRCCDSFHEKLLSEQKQQ